MLENTLMVGQQVAILFILMGAGALAAKVGWLRGDGARQITDIVFYIATPCVIVNSFLTTDFTPELIGGLLKTAAFAFAAHLFNIVLSRLVFRRERADRKSVYLMGVTFSNCGYMGIPLASGIFGTECVVYISVYIAVFNLFAWTYGITLWQKAPAADAAEGPAVSGPRAERGAFPRSMLLNPGVLSLAAGLIAAALRFHPPHVIAEPIRLLSSLNSPLAMIVLGYYLCVSSLRPQPGEGKMWLAFALRLLFIPAAALCVSYLLGLSGLWIAAALVLCSGPCATNVVMFASRFDGNTGLAARFVSICTLLSMLTMPVFLGVSLAVSPV